MYFLKYVKTLRITRMIIEPVIIVVGYLNLKGVGSSEVNQIWRQNS